MSRAICTSVAISCSLIVVTSSAQAASGAAMKPAPVTQSAPVATARARSARRVRPFLFSSSIFSSLKTMDDGASQEAAAALDDLDLVAIGVGDEKEPRDERVVVPEIHQLAGR